MTPSENLIDRIDSLMQRRRVFVASPAPQVSADSANSAASPDDDDVPILTEVVDIAEVSSDKPNVSAHHAIDPIVDAVTEDFSFQLQQRFSAQLPELIEAASARLAIELQQAVHRITDETLRDFVAQRRQRPLPLDGADPDPPA